MPADNDSLAAKGDYKSIAAQYARAKALKEKELAAKQRTTIASQVGALDEEGKARMDAVEKLNKRRATAFNKAWNWTASFFVALLLVHAAGIYFFTRGFLLTRLVLESKSTCTESPIEISKSFRGSGTVDSGCWHPKTFDKAVVIIIDALRYDFTIPFEDFPFADSSEKRVGKYYHDSLPFLYETAVKQPQNAFLRPFIADPPTTTLQRLKGLTTGTLPTFIDAGSNFAGTAIDEDNLLMQLRNAGRRMVHLGDDTWLSLFPGYFEEDISRAYDSFNVHDLHTVDNGVIENIMPLLKKERQDEWDVIFGHFLGVDHAGHRYGPDHPAMKAKLQQMDKVLREIVTALDDDTLLVVMGDHGMDSKGDHGGESDDEIEAALWMYSRKGIFGRTSPESVAPPSTAKERPVNQIDLLPTLSLLLGLPIPYNNLGKPIEEAFAGKKGNAWDNLAQVSRLTAAGIKRYQSSYYQARGMEEGSATAAAKFWNEATAAAAAKDWKKSYTLFTAYQTETLRICRDLWARFDVPSMVLGISLLGAGLLVLVQYIISNGVDLDAIQDPELDRAERSLELQSTKKGEKSFAPMESSLYPAAISGVIGALSGFVAHMVLRGEDATLLDNTICGLAISILATLFVHLVSTGSVKNPLPTTIWGWLAIIFTVSQSAGFASNSYTIWEDSILLFFLSTFGLLSAISSMRQKKVADRALGIYHSILFIGLGWVASFSKLCREEQAEYCFSTYYASSNSSTSAIWQVFIPYLLALFLPSIIKSYYEGTRSYVGFAQIWIDWALRIGLICNAIFWTMDAADDGSWIPNLPENMLKSSRVIIARTIFALALIAGMIAFGWATPCITITSAPVPETQQTQGGPRIIVLGYANAHGTRYFLLVLNVLLAVLLVQKPMGAGSIGMMALQMLSLFEIIDSNSLSDSPIGPIILGVLGSFHFFKTGHQAALPSIQWESAFIPLHTIKYPWSPLLVVLNTFGAQILTTVAVPLIALWKKEPREKDLLKKVARVVGIYILYFAVISLATTMWAGWLRRHLMLYRIFCPRFMMGAFVLLVVDAVAVLVALTGVRVNTMSVREIFGWP